MRLLLAATPRKERRIKSTAMVEIRFPVPGSLFGRVTPGQSHCQLGVGPGGPANPSGLGPRLWSRDLSDLLQGKPKFFEKKNGLPWLAPQKNKDKPDRDLGLGENLLRQLRRGV